MVPKFQVPTACFSCSPPDLNLSKLSSLADKATKIIFFFQNYTKSEIKIPRPLSQATASNHSKRVHFHSPLIRRTSGRSLGTFLQNDALSPSHNKVALTFSGTFHFQLLFPELLINDYYKVLFGLHTTTWTYPVFKPVTSVFGTPT
jgi:hypothetical protein